MTSGELASRLKKYGITRSQVQHWLETSKIASFPRKISPFSERVVADISEQEAARVEEICRKFYESNKKGIKDL